MIGLVILSVALLADRLVGDPDWLWRKWPHPVVLFGKAIGFADRQFNNPRADDRTRRSHGIFVIIALLILAIGAGILIHRLFSHLGPFGLVAEIIVVAVLLAQKSLSDHVLAVSVGLRTDGLAGGRRAVSMIVGRDPDTLDESGVCRAAIETLAENFSDGVIAPALYYAVFGLPGILAYKMLNTADSMIGHKTPRHLQFGWASARLDDLANWPAARLSMVILAAGAWLSRGLVAARNALRTGLSDGSMHRSPNSGWPEAAMAGALDIALAGPRIYGGQVAREPMINGAGKINLSAKDIDEAVQVFEAGCTVFNVAIPLVAILIMIVA